MKSQTLFLALAALSSVFAAPIQERSPRRTSTVTVVGKVVEVVHITSTVWVPANNAAPATSTAEPTEAAEPAVTAEPEPEVKEPEYVPEVPAPAPPVEEEQQEVIEQQPVEPVETTTSTPTPTPSPAPAPVPSPAPPMEEEKPVEQPVEQPVDEPENESTGDDSSSGSAFEGEGTFYTPGMGSCGETNSDGDSIVAISKDLMAEKDTGNPNTNPLCGQKIKLWGKNSEPVTVTVTDKCMGCAKNDIDMTPTVFAAIGYKESEGRMPVKWEWA